MIPAITRWRGWQLTPPAPVPLSRLTWWERFTTRYPQAVPIMRRIAALEEADAGDSHESVTLKSALANLRARYEDLADDQLGADPRVSLFHKIQNHG